MATKLQILSSTAAAKGSLAVPAQFAEPVRPDLIKRAALAMASHLRQPYGAMPGAGMRHSAKTSKRRRNYRGSYGMGISRVPRKIVSRQGGRMNWVGANAPGTVGGRAAHPPKASKIWTVKINDVERRKAIRSALAATLQPALVTARGHRIPSNYPFVVETACETLTKAHEVAAFLGKAGFGAELARLRPKPTTGRARRRGRAYTAPKGPLFVVSGPCPLVRAAMNVPGVEVANVNRLNARLLAPGTHPGRLTLFTEAAFQRLEAERLYTEDASPAPAAPTNVAPKKLAPAPGAPAKAAPNTATPPGKASPPGRKAAPPQKKLQPMQPKKPAA